MFLSPTSTADDTVWESENEAGKWCSNLISKQGSTCLISKEELNILIFTTQVGRGIIVGTLTIALLYWASRLFCSLNYLGNWIQLKYTICVQHMRYVYNIYNMCTKCNMCSGSLQLCNSSKVSSEIFEPWSVDGLKPWLSNCQKGGKYVYLSPLRSQGIRFESLMEERKMLLGTGCQNKSHGLRIGTVKSRMIWWLLWMVSDQCCQFCEKKNR